ncbi:MAG: efflux RND transporter permease subunit, partial [Tidjanibacter sp.]|nr:efflux RND transporter permease subunit [Tidjanibacter sp.]
FTSGAGENAGTFIVTLDDWKKRTTPETQINAIQGQLQKIAATIPEARINFFQPPAIMGLGVTGGVTFMLQANAGQSAQELYNAMNKMLMRLNSLPDVMMAFGNFETGTPELFLDIDREKAEALDVPVSRIFAVLQGNVASDYINDFNLHGYSFKVKMQSENQERADANELLQLMVQSDRGAMVPLTQRYYQLAALQEAPRRVEVRDGGPQEGRTLALCQTRKALLGQDGERGGCHSDRHTEGGLHPQLALQRDAGTL